MFAEVVLIQQGLLHIRKLRIEHFGMIVHFRNGLHHHHVVDRVERIPAPGERTVGMHENTRDRVRVDIPKCFGDHVAGLKLILPMDLRIGHLSGAGDRSVKIISVGRPERADWQPCLGIGNSPFAVGMNDSADIRKTSVKHQMGRRIAAGFVFPFDPFSARKIHDDHIFRLQFLIFDAAGFDDHQTAFPVDPADIAPGEDHKAVFREKQIRFPYFFFQFFAGCSSSTIMADADEVDGFNRFIEVYKNCLDVEKLAIERF